MNKKAIELSINFFVILIISIAILSFGIYFIGKIFVEVDKYKLILDSQTEKQLEDLMDTGQKVVIPFNEKEIKKKDMAVFGLGILNVMNGNIEFNVVIEASMASLETGIVINCPDTLCNTYDTWIKSAETNPFTPTIGKNEKKKYLFGILPEGPNAVKGTYVYDVTISYNSDLNVNVEYDKKKIRVKLT